MKKRIFLIMTSFVFLLFSLALAADIPMMLNYQGYLEYGEDEDSRVPFDGNGYFKFAIVNQADDTTYWSNNDTCTAVNDPNCAVIIPVTNGVFTVKLGDTDNISNMAALPTTVFDQQNIYVKVWFCKGESEGEWNFELLEPDTQIPGTQIVSAGFAYKAQTVVDGAVTSTIIQDGTITNDDISSTASIDASKIDTTGLNADTLDGNDSSAFASAGHTHTNIDALSLNGYNSSAFAPEIHTHTNYAGITHTHSGSAITSGTIPNERLDSVLQDLAQDLADGSLSASSVQHGAYFIDSPGTSGQVWKSKGSEEGYWDNTLWTQTGSNIYYNSGNVGIGTMSPDVDLHVANHIRIGEDPHFLALYGELKHDGGGNGFIINSNANGTFADLHLQTDRTTKMFIESYGNVGIGTTTQPQGQLQINASKKGSGVISSNGKSVTGDDKTKFNEEAQNGWLITAGNQTRVIEDILDEKNLTLTKEFTNDLDKMKYVLTDPQKPVVFKDGKVGIGTTSPQGKLDVGGGDLVVDPNTGYVGIGIGTESPTEKLEVVGTVKATSFVGDGSQLTGNVGQWSEGTQGIYYNDGKVLIGSSGFYIPHTLTIFGSAFATDGFINLSDYRHKRNINDISFNALELIKDLHPVTFEWKEPLDSGMEGTQLGFIAQEVEKVLPEAVLTQDNDEQTKGLKYNTLIPLLTKAIQELEAQNEALKAENNSLRDEIDQIKETIGL